MSSANPFTPVTVGPAAQGISELPATLRLGAVHLTVTDLDRSVAWYQAALGLRVHRHDVDSAALGDGEEDVLVLHEDSTAKQPGRTSGLYHYALLFPTREELARTALRLAAAKAPIQGASDHGTHEAIYLPDLDGNGIELAADRPRDQWPTPEEEFTGDGPKRLDLDALLATVSGEELTAQVRPGLRVGHLHLHVGDIAAGLALLPRRARLRGLGQDAHRRVRLGRWLPPSLGLQHLARRGRGADARRDRGPAPLDDRAGHGRRGRDRARPRARGRDRREDVPGGFAVTDPFGMTVHVVAAGA